MLYLSDYITGFYVYNKKLMTRKVSGKAADKSPDSINTALTRKKTATMP